MLLSSQTVVVPVEPCQSTSYERVIGDFGVYGIDLNSSIQEEDFLQSGHSLTYQVLVHCIKPQQYLKR